MPGKTRPLLNSLIKEAVSNVLQYDRTPDMVSKQVRRIGKHHVHPSPRLLQSGSASGDPTLQRTCLVYELSPIYAQKASPGHSVFGTSPFIPLATTAKVESSADFSSCCCSLDFNLELKDPDDVKENLEESSVVANTPELLQNLRFLDIGYHQDCLEGCTPVSPQLTTNNFCDTQSWEKRDQTRPSGSMTKRAPGDGQEAELPTSRRDSNNSGDATETSSTMVDWSIVCPPLTSHRRRWRFISHKVKSLARKLRRVRR